MTKINENYISNYLQSIDENSQKVLQNLRNSIKKIIPEVSEGESYGMPAFIYKNKAIAGFIATKKHFSYFPMSVSVIDQLKKELKSYETSKGTVRFTSQNLINEDLIKKLLLIRKNEIDIK